MQSLERSSKLAVICSGRHTSSHFESVRGTIRRRSPVGAWGIFFEVLEGGAGTAYSLAVLGKGLRGVGLCWCSKAGEVEGFRVCAFGV